MTAQPAPSTVCLYRTLTSRHARNHNSSRYRQISADHSRMTATLWRLEQQSQDNFLIKPPAAYASALPETLATSRLTRAISSTSPQALPSTNLSERYSQ